MWKSHDREPLKPALLLHIRYDALCTLVTTIQSFEHSWRSFCCSFDDMKNLSVFYIGVVGLVVCGLCTDVLLMPGW